MKNMILSLVAALFLLISCDDVNKDIDDLPRTLRIAVRTINDTENPYDGLIESGSQVVSTGAGNNIATGTAGTVTVTAGVKDTYVRSDSVTVEATDGTLAFAFWLLPSRTDSGSDPSSIEGNIRYDVATGGGANVSLRTDNEQTEIVGAFAKDSSAAFTNLLTLSNVKVDNKTRFSFDLDNLGVVNKTINNPMYRIFDDLGEARTAWLEFDSADSHSNDSIILSSGSNLYSKELSGIIDPGVLGNWTVVILYKDPADNDNVYVVK